MPRISPRSSKSWDSDGSEVEDGDEKDEVIQSGIFKQYLEICDDLGEEEDAERDAVFARGLARVQEYLSAGQSNSMCLICLATIKPSQAIWHCGESCYAVFHLPCIQEWARNQLEAAALRASNQLGHEASQAALAEARAAACWGCPKCRQLYPRAQLPSAYACFCGKEADPEWDPWLAPHTCGQLCEKPLPGSCQHTCTLLCHPGPCPPCPLVVSARCHCGKLALKQRCGHNQFSCREVCGRRLACGHTCPEICHPGECPPCQQLGTFKCRCGADSRQMACSARDFQCPRTCGKLVACGRHRCEQQCHAGPCGGCPFEGARTCPCGKASYPGLKCDEAAAPCGESCGKLLACGMHTCVERCHYGECPKVCRDVVTKTCRCGKTQKSVLCHQEVLCEKRCNELRACGRHPCKRKCCDGNCPPCEEVCNRWLRCNNHRCPAPCHTGPCRPCPLTFTVSCACGATKHTLPCGAEGQAVPPRCTKPCAVPALCRHAAEQAPHRCHYGPCPACRKPCGTQLACGHACSSGNCHDPRPPAVAEWQRPKPTKTSAHAAGSSSSSSKGGTASGRSSSPVDTVQPAAAAAAAAARVLLEDAAIAAAAGGGGTGAVNGSSAGPGTRTPCPTCTVPVTVGCVGHHLQQAFPCCEAKPFSCGRPCGQLLACGNHTCSKPCHAISPGAAAQPSSSNSSRGATAAPGQAKGIRPPSSTAAAAAAAAAPVACEVCSRPCTQSRSCEHPCTAGCHPGPCQPCQVARSCSCHCGKTSLRFPCCEYQALQQQQQQQVAVAKGGKQAAGRAGRAGRAGEDPLCCGKPCHRELQHCRHPCRAACHLGPCPAAEQCEEEVTVRCECRRQKQKWPCHKVQKALLATSGSRGYDSAVAPRVLACDAACAAAAAAGGSGEAASKSKRSSSPVGNQSSKAGAGPAAGKQAAAAAETAAAAAAGAKGSKKLTRAEREALAAQKEAERRKQEQRKKLQGWLHFLGVMLVIVAVGVGLGLTVLKLLRTVDQKAQEVWRPDEV